MGPHSTPGGMHWYVHNSWRSSPSRLHDINSNRYRPLDASAQDGDTPTQATTSVPQGHDAGLNEAPDPPDISNTVGLENNVDGLKLIHDGFETEATLGGPSLLPH